MNKFALERIDQVEGKQPFFKLIESDECEFDNFCFQLEQSNNPKDTSELISIFRTMNFVANLIRLPKTKFRALKGATKFAKEYEIETKNYRVYLFHQEKTGKIVVCGGTKKTQKKDIAIFRKTIKEYFDSSNH